MNAIKNKVQLIGHVGAKPEVKTLESGKKVAHFDLATNDTYRKGNGEKVTETQWHKVVAWEKLAEIAEKFMDKGKEVALEGRLSNRSYTDKDGVKKYVCEVVATELLLLGAKASQ